MEARCRRVDAACMPAYTPEAVHDRLCEAFNNQDVDAFLALYDADAVLAVPPDGQRARGHDAIQQAVLATFALHPAADIQVVDKLECDGLALTLARWRIVLDIPTT